MFNQYFKKVAASIFAIMIAGIANAGGHLKEINFSLDWAWQGMHGPFLLAKERGYYEEVGLSVNFDRGFGSGDTISKIAAKAYPMGFAEGTSLLKFNAENPDDQVITVLVINDQSPTGVISTKSNGISKPSDLMGKKVSATQSAATVLLWPVFAEINNLDPDGIEYLFVEPSLRDSMVVQGQADATFGFSSTTVLNMVQAGVPEDEVTYFTMAQYGLKPYSSSIIVRKDYAAENPDIVKGFVAATVKGMIDMLNDPDAGIALLKKQEPLIDVKIETARWYLAEELAILTPEVVKNGISVVDRKRYETAASQVAGAFDLPIKPNMDDYYDPSFLPPLEMRQIPQAVKDRLK